MSLIQFGGPSSAVTIFPAVQHVVEVKSSWSGAWMSVPYLRCRSATDCVAPAYGQARFTWFYGRIKHEDRTAFQTFRDLNLSDAFVRVRVLSQRGSAIYWTGMVVADSLVPGGKGTGSQDFEAVGLCQLLDRETIRTATVADVNGQLSEIQWVPAINQRYQQGVGVVGNRSDTRDDAGVCAFGGENKLWTHLQAAEMVLAKYAPANGPHFELGGQRAVLTKMNGVTQMEGRTPWAVLNELISRNRGLVLAPVVNGDTVTLMVDTILDTSVSVGSVTLPANQNRYSLNLDSFIELDHARVVYSVATKFDRIEFRGARLLACGTFSHQDGTLEMGWKSAEAENEDDASDEKAYQNGIKDRYDALEDYLGHEPDDSEKAEANDHYRQDVRFEMIYTKHRVPRNWDGYVGDAKGGGKMVLLAQCSDDGTVAVSSAAPLWMAGKYFETWLPFQEGVDYSVNPPVVTGQRDGAEPAYVRPFALIEDPSGYLIADEPQYHQTDRPALRYEHCAAHLSVLPRELAIMVEANPRHLYAKGTFITDQQAEEHAEPTNAAPQFDYRKLLATLAVRLDTVLRLVVTRDGAGANAMRRTLVVDVPDAEYWFCAANTVVGVQPLSGLKRVAGQLVLRNDIARLKERAPLAKAWYCRDRASITVPIRRIDKFVPLGALIDSAVTAGTRRAVGTVVTSQGWDFDSGVTTVQTQWAELDLSGSWS